MEVWPDDALHKNQTGLGDPKIRRPARYDLRDDRDGGAILPGYPISYSDGALDGTRTRDMDARLGNLHRKWTDRNVHRHCNVLALMAS